MYQKLDLVLVLVLTPKSTQDKHQVQTTRIQRTGR